MTGTNEINIHYKLFFFCIWTKLGLLFLLFKLNQANWLLTSFTFRDADMRDVPLCQTISLINVTLFDLFQILKSESRQNNSLKSCQTKTFCKNNFFLNFLFANNFFKRPWS